MGSSSGRGIAAPCVLRFKIGTAFVNQVILRYVMSRILPFCCLVALALFPSACLGWSLYTRTGENCARCIRNTCSFPNFSSNFVALCTADPSLQSAITAVGFDQCKSVPQTSSGNTGPLPGLDKSCCALMDKNKPLFGSIKSGSGMCQGGILVQFSLFASVFFFGPHAHAQTVTLYTDDACSSTSVAQQNVRMQMGCTNNASTGAARMSTTVDCSPG